MFQLFFGKKFISGYLLLFVFLKLGINAQDISGNSEIKGVRPPVNLGSPFLMTTANPTGSSKPAYTRLQERLSAIHDCCLVPPQPENGVRRLHEHHCREDVEDCDIAEGVELAPGNLLNYTCDPGYKLFGNPYVLCQGKGIWSSLPICIEVKCNPLNSSAMTAKYFRSGRWVSCDSMILPGTRAKISCRPGFMDPMTYLTNHSAFVECNMDGKWEPNPIECVPVCGVPISGSTTDFPWHASIYKRFAEDGIKFFQCGATVVRNNLVLTAANCVYEDETNTTTDPGSLFVMTGNIFQDYDHPLHDPKKVWKSAVKAVHINADYVGPAGESPADIALVEIQKPFECAIIHGSACLDDSEYAHEMLQPGAYGSIAEFGSTVSGGQQIPNGILSIKSVPYVPHNECRTSGMIAVQKSLTSDKFCAGYSNGSSVCVNNKGGGLVFERNNFWYIMGIVTEIPDIEFSDSELKCTNYAIYTNVSEYTAWIQDVIFNLERKKSPTRLTMTTETARRSIIPTESHILPNLKDFFCPAPPQPKNGEWRIHGYPCTNNTDCKIPEGTELEPGSQLVYSCFSGHRPSGSLDVYCGSSGNWSIIPACDEIKCDPLNSASTLASCCGRFGEWVSCDLPVPPGTRAKVSCHLGYRMDSAFATFRRKSVKCNENGKWAPDPITCVPVCGVPVARQKPLAIGASPAKVGDFPWHASLYMKENSSRGSTKKFICGASIIHSNFLLTAAHCVYDEEMKKAENPEKLFVMTGNVFRDYDYSGHNRDVVKKRAVKHVYMPCNYYGIRGNYVSDIALLELDRPFEFSGILLPTCLDVEGYTERILEPGAYGRVAGFGRTATGESSGILQTLSLPYISYNRCRNASNIVDNEVLISDDKFCAGYTNGSAVCEGDSGGGLVFKKGELWYVMGIVSLGLGVDFNKGERTCDRYSYSLYTKVSEHMVWIQDVMFQRAQNKAYPSCDDIV